MTNCADIWDTASGPDITRSEDTERVTHNPQRPETLKSWYWKLGSLTCSNHDSSLRKPSFSFHVFYWRSSQLWTYHAYVILSWHFVKYIFLPLSAKIFERLMKKVIFNITLVIRTNILFKHWERTISVWHWQFWVQYFSGGREAVRESTICIGTHVPWGWNNPLPLLTDQDSHGLSNSWLPPTPASPSVIFLIGLTNFFVALWL